MTKLFLNVISLISIAFALTACGVNKNTTAKNRQTAPKGAQSNYYDQFIFKVHGDCKEPSTVLFQSLHAWEPALLGKDDEDELVFALLSIQLFNDGTYWASYTERKLASVVEGGLRYKTLFNKENLNGTWVVNNNRIELKGLGYGEPTKYINYSTGKASDSILFTIKTIVNDFRAFNSVMNITRSISNIGPKGVSINKFCNIQ